MLFLHESENLHKFDHLSFVKFNGINYQSIKIQYYLSPMINTKYLRNGSLKEIIDKQLDNDWSPTKNFDDIFILLVNDFYILFSRKC